MARSQLIQHLIDENLDLKRRLEAAEDREAYREKQPYRVLRELRLMCVKLPIAQQLMVEELQRELGAW